MIKVYVFGWTLIIRLTFSENVKEFEVFCEKDATSEKRMDYGMMFVVLLRESLSLGYVSCLNANNSIRGLSRIKR